jgi:hypothetical protein
MPILRDWNLALDADKVLWGEGADPAVIRARRPKLAEMAEHIIEDGRPLLEPAVTYERYQVAELRHERLRLGRPQSDGGPAGSLAGPLIAQHLGGAQEVVVAVCTIGDRLSTYASEQININAVRGLALDGLASAAAETLAEAMCRWIEDRAAEEQLQTSIPLNPGMIGWSYPEGQQQIFALLDAQSIGVSLHDSGLMEPIKSVSLVVGLGRELGHAGRSCDFCAMRGLCRYNGHAN